MSLQPLQLANIPHVRIVGEVTIHPSAAIAPGVILQAAPNSQIIIAAGACVGMGVILNAYGGKIELEAGVSLGAGVLVVGCSKIGANTCIGGATTIYNSDLDSLQVIPAGSVIGDPSRRIELISEPETDRQQPELPQGQKQNISFSSSEKIAALPTNSDIDSDISDPWAAELEEKTEPTVDLAMETTIEPVGGNSQNSIQDREQNPLPKQSGTPVFGKVYVNQLLLTLFPERIQESKGDEG